ncbi:methyltransferase domain-containing protein [Ideonella sp. 4Y11]|uniref:Methyltransferase domain-containing protein n=1 Tax=Ideonella aquatica TaxID=2824119 RepID=A0A940YK46_9BURK|nr:class I SAM-dependent methyltransferase [Ideonella aquatica]MBQ0959329.1 methyltransferase domain-containing protein [Ideonella aquatica]
MTLPLLKIERFLAHAHSSDQGATWRAMSALPVKFDNAEEYPSTYELLASSLNSARPAAAVLDLACGDGQLLNILASRAPTSTELFGVDMSPEELVHARGLLGPRATLQLGRAQALPFAAQTFDLVLSHMALMLFEQEHLVVAEIERVLRPGGRLSAVVGVAPPKSQVQAVFSELLSQYERLPEWRDIRFRSRLFSSPSSIAELLVGFTDFISKSCLIAQDGTPLQAWAWFGGMYELHALTIDQRASLRDEFLRRCGSIALDGRVTWKVKVLYFSATRVQPAHADL